MTRTQKLKFVGSLFIYGALAGVYPFAVFFGATSVADAASGDGPVAGVIIDEFNVLHPGATDVIVTTGCLEGNPFVPGQPPPGLGRTLSGCRLDIPAGGETGAADNNQLITVLPNNFGGVGDLTSVRTYGTGSSVSIESNVTVRALSKDIFLGLANPALFDGAESQDVSSTADVFCTSIASKFVCARIEPVTAGPNPSACPSPTAPLMIVESGEQPEPGLAEPFCSRLTRLLQGAYNVQRNPLAYAITTNMSNLADAGSVRLKLCAGFQAKCLSPDLTTILSNVRVTTMQTQSAFVETPRTSRTYYP